MKGELENKMLEKKYAEAFAEVLWYLKGIKKCDYCKIPIKLIDFLEKNASNEFDRFDYTKPLKNLKLKDESIALIDMIYLNYWCETEEVKNKFISILNNNSQKHQEDLKSIYSLNVFENKNTNIEDVEENSEEVALIKYNEKILDKIIRKIIEILKIFKR